MSASTGPRSQVIHANYSHLWSTTPEWLTWVAATLGHDYFDPCPENWDGETNGLEIDWCRSNYVNHPGGRGKAVAWWKKCVKEINEGNDVIWCGFTFEHLRYMDPSPLHMPGWLILPRRRIPFIWRGPDLVLPSGSVRKHGDLGKSPGNWTVFWSSVAPAEVPEDCVIIRTGVGDGQ